MPSTTSTGRRDRPDRAGDPEAGGGGDPGTARASDPGTGRASRHWAVLAWTLWGLMLVGLALVAWMDGLLRRAGRPELVSLGSDAWPYLLAMLSAGTVGAVVASRRPRHPVGWLLLGLELSVIGLGIADAYAAYGLLARPGSLPGASWAAIYVDESWVVLSTLLGFVLLLTPTGSLPSPRWRWWARLVVAAAVVGVLVNTQPMDAPYAAVARPLLVQDGPLATVAWLSSVISLLGLLVAAGSLVVRFRRARGVERLQLRWVALAAAVAGLAIAVILVSWATMGARPSPCGSGRPCSTWSACPWPPGRRSCATGCTTWTGSSAAPWPGRP